MRQIEASEVKPGMTIRWRTTMQVDGQLALDITGGVTVYDEVGNPGYISGNTPVTVLAEPAPPEPEEPRWIAARAKVGDRRFFRVDESDRPWRKADCMGHIFPYRYSWSDVCSLGPVTVVPDQGWTVPADTPEVPDRIEEWPEDDTALRPYPWRDDDRYIWRYESKNHGEGWTPGHFLRSRPLCGPWTRVTDA